MQDSQNKRNDSDEIDLRQLFAAIGNFFSNIGKGIVNAVIRAKRRTFEYKWVIVVCIVLGALLGAAYSYNAKPVYTSALLLRSEYFNRRIIDNSIEKLNMLSKETEKQGLANALGIELSMAENIVGFRAEPFVSDNEVVEVELLKERLSKLDLGEQEVNNIINRIDIENKNAYQIFVDATESAVIGNLEEALINFFRNNAYIANRIKVKEEGLLARKAKLIEENEKMDSLKRAMIKAFESISSKSKQGSDNLYIGEQYTANPIQVFQEGLKINQEIISIDRQLSLKYDFELIDGMTEFSEPSSKGLVFIMAFAMLLGLGFAYLIIVLLTISKYLEGVEEERFNNNVK